MNWCWREAGRSSEVEESTEWRKIRKSPRRNYWEEGKGQQHRGGLAWAFTVAGMKAEETEPRVLCCACSVAQSRPALCNPMDCSPPGSSVLGESPGKNTGMGSLSLLQEIFPIQESNRGLLHHTQIVYQLSYQGSLEWRICMIYSTPTLCQDTLRSSIHLNPLSPHTTTMRQVLLYLHFTEETQPLPCR